MSTPEKHTSLLDDRSLTDAIRDGLITPATSPTGKPPPRKPVMPFEDLMEELQRDREDRN